MKIKEFKLYIETNLKNRLNRRARRRSWIFTLPGRKQSTTKPGRANRISAKLQTIKMIGFSNDPYLEDLFCTFGERI